MKRLRKVQANIMNEMSDTDVLQDLDNLCNDIDEFRVNLDTLASQYKAASQPKAASIVHDVGSLLETAKQLVIRKVRTHFDRSEYSKYDF